MFAFDAEGKLLKKIDGGLKAPMALSFGGGKLYAADTGNSRVAVFDGEGKFLWAFSSQGDAPGQLKSPRGDTLTGGRKGVRFRHRQFQDRRLQRRRHLPLRLPRGQQDGVTKA